jgi:glutamate-1-semialdehyde 2,1-aminomutase
LALEMKMVERSARERELVEIAAKVLPGGGFGNVTTDVVLREGKAGSRVGRQRQRVCRLPAGLRADVHRALPSGGDGRGAGAVDAGTTFPANNEYGILLAEAIVGRGAVCRPGAVLSRRGRRRMPTRCAWCGPIRGREKILKFEGGYHGMSDWGLLSLAPKSAGQFPAGGAGHARHSAVGAERGGGGAVSTTSTRRCAMIREYADELAGVIAGAVPALDRRRRRGSWQALREVTAELGIPLIFDEVVTGFRFAYGGAQELLRHRAGHLHAWEKSSAAASRWRRSRGQAEIMALFDRGQRARRRAS